MTSRAAACGVLVLGAALGVGCSSGGTPGDGGTGGGGGSSLDCLFDTDCPDPILFFCNKTTARCEPGCVNSAECSAARRGQYALDYCSTDGGGLGCQCDEGRCVASLCSSDAECGSQVCRSGACVAPPPASAVAGCSVVPDLVVVRAGAKVRFQVLAVDASGQPVVVPAGASWSVATPGPLAGASASGQAAEFTAQTPTAGSGAPAEAVLAQVGPASCRASAIVLPASPAAGEVWAVVTDELSGRPLAGVAVLVSQDDGTPVGDAVPTDGRGLARLTVPGTLASYSVTAFGPDHDYLTVAGYRGSSRYLSLVTRRNQVDRYGGYAGTYTALPAASSADVHLGFAGASLAGSITNLSVSQLLGPSVPTDIKLGQINQPGVPVPAGIFIGLGDPPIKGRYGALGLAGTCALDGGALDEARIAAGACGTRSAWSLAGDIKVTVVLALASGLSGGTTPDLASLVGSLAPALKTFRSSVARDVTFGLRPTPLDDAGQPDFRDQSGFTPLDLPFGQLPLSFDFAARLPDLPRYRGVYADNAVAVGSVAVPGRGEVPLGLGAGTNADHDAKLDRAGSYATPGLLGLRMAPAHHGLEGWPYHLLVAALSSAPSTDVSAAAGASALLARVPGNALAFNPDGTAPVDLTGLAFLGFPDGARFNFLDTADADGLGPRSFRFAGTAPDLAGATLLRVTFVDDLGRRWEVVADPVRAAAGFRLPKLPAGSALADRLFATGLASGARSSLLVQTQRLAASPAQAPAVPLGFNEVVELGSTNADRTSELLTGFTFLAYGRPAVAFTTPAASPATVAPASKLVLQVTGFKLGTAPGSDGVVGLTFSGAAGCPPVQLFQETTAGNGVLEATLAATCTGARTVTATLLRPDGATPIQPGASTSVQLTIQ